MNDMNDRWKPLRGRLMRLGYARQVGMIDDSVQKDTISRELTMPLLEMFEDLYARLSLMSRIRLFIFYFVTRRKLKRTIKKLNESK